MTDTPFVRSGEMLRLSHSANLRTLGGDFGHTRYSPLDQITPANFETLKEAWRSSPLDVVGPLTARATPSYVGGKLLSVAGPRRHVVSLDPTNGRLLWSWVEPETYRSKYSMRTAYGKGVAYSEINGKGVVYIATPGFFLVALDADTGQPLPNWGRPVGLPGFPGTGVVDLAEVMNLTLGHARSSRQFSTKLALDRATGGFYSSLDSTVILMGGRV